MFDDFKARMGELLHVPRRLEAIHDRIDLLRSTVQTFLERPERPPFVCVVAFADVRERHSKVMPAGGDYRFGFRSDEEEVRLVPTTLGDSGYIEHETRLFRLEPHVQLQKLHIMVFCDLERVLVRGCNAGNESLSASPISSSPVFYYDGVLMPGTRVTIQCDRRVLY